VVHAPSEPCRAQVIRPPQVVQWPERKMRQAPYFN
jgi:hypothetical protein